MSSAGHFVATLAALPALPAVFNPWRDVDPLHDVGPEAPVIRSANLTRYLAARAGRAKLLLVAEAPGYQGCHFSGIAMTSERILLGHKKGIPPEAIFPDPDKRQASRPDCYPTGANEPTASIVWSLLLGMGLPPESFVLWNAFPCHPHRHGDLLTNRAPTRGELAAAAHVLPQMIRLMAGSRVVAVGRVAQNALAGLGVTAPSVRHPAMGGAESFRTQMRALLHA
jgi:hypothetical protein